MLKKNVRDATFWIPEANLKCETISSNTSIAYLLSLLSYYLVDSIENVSNNFFSWLLR